MVRYVISIDPGIHNCGLIILEKNIRGYDLRGDTLVPQFDSSYTVRQHYTVDLQPLTTGNDFNSNSLGTAVGESVCNLLLNIIGDINGTNLQVFVETQIKISQNGSATLATMGNCIVESCYTAAFEVYNVGVTPVAPSTWKRDLGFPVIYKSLSKLKKECPTWNLKEQINNWNCLTTMHEHDACFVALSGLKSHFNG
jgi:hypothetical protein